MSTLIEIQNLTKSFDQFTVVDAMSFTVKKGEVLGFLGPNGAGKSTTMKMITGFLTPDEGTIRVNGIALDEDPLAVKRCIGYLPEGAPAYTDMTTADFLNFIAEIRGFSGAEKKYRIAQTIARVNLEAVMYQQIETLSKGYKRRVGLAQAILHDPSILILDEPTDGLDPNQKHEVRSLITTMAKEKVIILSTHILEEVHAVCNRAIIIAKGKIVTDGTPSELEAQSQHCNSVTLAIRADSHAHDGITSILSQQSEIATVETVDKTNDSIRYRLIPHQHKKIIDKVSQCAHQHTWHITELFNETGQLDDVFRHITTV